MQWITMVCSVAGCSKVHKNAPDGSAFAHDNIQSFLKGCKDIGVPSVVLFESVVLTSAKDPR